MRRSHWLLVLCAALCVNVYLYSVIFSQSGVRVESLQVGKGTALLVKAPSGHAVLVGAGPDAGIVRALGEALGPWQRHLDALIILHVTGAEAGGAPMVLEHYRVGTLLRTNVEGTPTREAALAKAASAAKGLKITEAPRGARVILHYRSLTLELSASTTPGTYPLR